MHKIDKKRIQWYTQARFGLFIHWGLYAIPARGEWVRSNEEIPTEAYEPLKYEFKPDSCDPASWARLAKKAGMRYAVLTAKHHDGYCLFDTKTTDFCAPMCCGRDFVREFLDAFRAEGIRVGLYYSLLDWHHPDYPHYGDLHHPMRRCPECGNGGRDFNRYLDYMHEQVRELCTNYGKLDILWFDFSYGTLTGEAWRGSELVRMVRSLQPDVILNNRLEASGSGFGSLITSQPTDICGDFVSPEQIIPPEGIVDESGNPVPWESCITLNNHWGYCAADLHYKPADMVIKKLVECVSKGGNLIVNVGPDARGRIPAPAESILCQVGQWMRDNAASVCGCGHVGIPKPEYGRVTGSPGRLYYHVMEGQVGYVLLPGLKRNQAASIRLLRDGSELAVADNWITQNYPEWVFVKLGDSPLLPDPVDTVIEVRLR